MANLVYFFTSFDIISMAITKPVVPLNSKAFLRQRQSNANVKLSPNCCQDFR